MSAGHALLKRFLRERSGLALENDKNYLIEDRLNPILRSENLTSLEDLAQRLHQRPQSDLATAVIEALTINETSFFRDRTLFNSFSERLLPALIAARQDRRRLRIWCAGCSTGQEPYSLAMLIDEYMRRLSGWQVEIFATDLSRQVIESAKRGRYSQFEVQRGLPVSMLLRHFSRQGDHWQINDHLRAKVEFRARNLMSTHRDFGTFDIIFCRNVLIYFDVTDKRRVLANLADAMAEDGVLVLGAAETVSGLSDCLRAGRSHFLFEKSPRADLSERNRMSA